MLKWIINTTSKSSKTNLLSFYVQKFSEQNVMPHFQDCLIQMVPFLSMGFKICWQFPQQRSKTPLSKKKKRWKDVQGMTLNFIWWWSFSSGFLLGIQYVFIAITPRSTPTHSGSICKGPIYGINTYTSV